MSEVAYKSSNGQNDVNRLHRDPDCYRLGKARATIEVDLAAYPGPWRVTCSVCWSEEKMED